MLGFLGQQVHARGFVDLLTTFGAGPAYRTLNVRYILVEADTSYNVLIGRCTLNQLGAVVSTPHMAMKFPAPDGTIVTVKADPKEAQQCYVQSLKVSPYSLKTIGERATQTEELQTPVAECNQVEQSAINHTSDEEEVDLDPRVEYEGKRPTFDEPMFAVQLGPSPHQSTRVGLNSPGLIRENIERVLIANSDLFS